MNKKGFTLIELLAVIVILAIIALIATPIVLNIINETRDSAGLRSAEFYLDAVEYGIAREVVNGEKIETNTYNIMDNGDICLEYNAKNECIKLLKIDVKGKKPTSGTIKIESGEISDISLNIENKVIVKDDKGNLIYKDDVISICTLASDSIKEANEIGAKYECKVDPNKDPYTFFVLSYNHASGETNKTKEGSVTTNLIMESNIRTGGNPVQESNPTVEEKGEVAWYASAPDSTSGPVTAMNYLYEATTNWSNVLNIVMDYTDEGNTGNYGYGGIKTDGNITKITKKDGTVTKTYENLKARMPYKSEISDYNGDNAYLYNYLELRNNIQANPVSGVSYYWTLSTFASASYNGNACLVNTGGNLSCMDDIVNVSGLIGVRPVITLEL